MWKWRKRLESLPVLEGPMRNSILDSPNINEYVLHLNMFYTQDYTETSLVNCLKSLLNITIGKFLISQREVFCGELHIGSKRVHF